MVTPFSTQYDNSKTRRGIEVVADFDNHLYATAGTGVWDNTMWWSQDGALTWYRMSQVNTVSSGFFIQASSSCLGLNYRTNTSSSSGYTKQLILYAGTVLFDDGTAVGALQISVSDPVVFLPTNPNAGPFNATAAPAPSGPSSAAKSSSSSSSSTGALSPSSSSSSSSSTGTSRGSSGSPNPTGVASTAVPVVSSDSSSGLSGGAIAGIVVGSVVGGMLICFLFVVCFIMRVRNGKKPKTETSQYATNDHTAEHSEVEMHQTE